MEMAFPSSYVVDCFPTYPPWSLLPPSDFVFSVNCTICSPSLRSAFSTFGSALANIDSIVVFRTVFYFSSLLYRGLKNTRELDYSGQLIIHRDA